MTGPALPTSGRSAETAQSPPPKPIVRRQAGDVSRVDGEHAMELEPDRPRLNVADAREEECRQHVAVGQPLLHPVADLFQQLQVFHNPEACHRQPLFERA